MTSGLFITLEGLDGSGKTTQLHLLAARLRAEGRAVTEAIEPGGTAIGQSIRKILLDPANQNLSSATELLLYFAARAQNLAEVIQPALAAGSIVLADRFTDSTLAYQGFGRRLGEGVVLQLHAFACHGRNPDLTLWIDTDLDTALGRAKTRNREQGAHDGTRMDEQDHAFYERVQEGYAWIAARDPHRFRRVDGRGTVEEVAARVWAAVNEFRGALVP